MYIILILYNRNILLFSSSGCDFSGSRFLVQLYRVTLFKDLPRLFILSEIFLFGCNAFAFGYSVYEKKSPALSSGHFHVLGAVAFFMRLHTYYWIGMRIIRYVSVLMVTYPI